MSEGPCQTEMIEQDENTGPAYGEPEEESAPGSMTSVPRKEEGPTEEVTENKTPKRRELTRTREETMHEGEGQGEKSPVRNKKTDNSLGDKKRRRRGDRHPADRA